MKVEAIGDYEYYVIYNNENTILVTESLSKAIKMAKDCAKCAENPCTYQVYCQTISLSMKIAEYKVTE